jgi:acetyl esterase
MIDLSRPYEVERRDVVYLRHGETEYLARVWEPLGGPKAGRIAVVDAHGGAWCDNDRRFGARYDVALAAAGAVVVALDFRTGPDHRHPSGSADVTGGVRWAKANAQVLGIDEHRVLLVGSSSGGHLAALAAIRPNEDEHLGGEFLVNGSWQSLDTGDASVAGVAPFWPPLDPLARYRYASALDTDHGRRLKSNTEKYFGTEAVMASGSVADVVGSGAATSLPPMWLVEAENDLNVPTPILDAVEGAYLQAGGEFRRTCYRGAAHAFGHYESEQCDEFLADLCEWVAGFA